MHERPLTHRASRALPWLLLAAALLAFALPVQAQLFGGDDEARRAIIELRARVEANRLAAEQERQQGASALRTEFERQIEAELTPLRRSLLELGSQNDALRRELADLRGQNERLAHLLAEQQRQQRDLLAEQQRQQRDLLAQIDQRLRPLEPLTVTVEGVEFQTRPEEAQAFEAAMQALRASEFERAARLYSDLIAHFPRSGYVVPALYWQGNAQYAARQYAAAVESFRRMVAAAPRHPRVPDALLGLANSHIELRDTRAARTVLQELIQAHPNTEAAAVARERLARLR